MNKTVRDVFATTARSYARPRGVKLSVFGRRPPSLVLIRHCSTVTYIAHQHKFHALANESSGVYGVRCRFLSGEARSTENREAGAGAKSKVTTPMMKQWLALKEECGEALLFFRMGDFYEFFFEDAQTASSLLGIVLTTRGTHKGQAIPMCGIPAHARDNYLSKLMKKGVTVAVAEQVEDVALAKKDGRVVKREIIRVLTPGTVTEDVLLHPTINNYLASIVPDHSETGNGEPCLAWVDISTGDFKTTSLADEDKLIWELERIAPSELLIPENAGDYFNLQSVKRKFNVRTVPPQGVEEAARLLDNFFASEKEACSELAQGEVLAVGTLLEYINVTQKGHLPRLSVPASVYEVDNMVMDSSTRKLLELTRSMNRDSKSGSVLFVIDRTLTAGGGRLQTAWLGAPLTSPVEINRRLDAVDAFVSNRRLTEKLRSTLSRSQDLQRCVQRLSLRRGSPRDLAAVGKTIKMCEDLVLTLEDDEVCPEILREGRADVWANMVLQEELDRAVVASPPSSLSLGDFVKDGYSAELDEKRSLRDSSKKLMRELEAKFRKETGIPSLKIKFNNIHRYHVEVTAKNSVALAKDDRFAQIQTLGSGTSRFQTEELVRLSRQIFRAAEDYRVLEEEIFEQLNDKVSNFSGSINRMALWASTVDVLTSLAILAVDCQLVRPVVDRSHAFHILNGRHLVVESNTEDIGFVHNSCDLSQGSSFWTITGPNMGGKSTFLRQNALIAILAQMGSFVPADSARIGVVDRLFTRIGASDDLSNNQSTFMLEMDETSVILKNATKSSLVIMDEIGRGTAVHDGLAIAAAVVEQLLHLQCRTLFATHYHELVDICKAKGFGHFKSFRVLVEKTESGDLMFMYRLVENEDGARAMSYGIDVAKLAGIPPAVIQRAEELYHQLSTGRLDPNAHNRASTELEEELKKIEPENLSPKEALDLIFQWKSIIDKSQ